MIMQYKQANANSNSPHSISMHYLYYTYTFSFTNSNIKNNILITIITIINIIIDYHYDDGKWQQLIKIIKLPKIPYNNNLYLKIDDFVFNFKFKTIINTNMSYYY